MTQTIPPVTNLSCRYGAPMGRPNELGGEPTSKIHLRHVPFVDGAYDQGGAYWGMPANLWCAWGTDTYDGTTDHFHVFVRANSRAQAKRIIKDEFWPDAEFYV